MLDIIVSILVLVDDGRRHPQSAVDIAVIRMFQSLFLWMTVVDADRAIGPRLEARVSILVLVDDGRRPPPTSV